MYGMDWASVGVIAEIAAAVATAGTIAWAVFEFRRKRVAELDERAAELRSVTLTYELIKPRPSEVVDDAGVWAYKFSVHNPGRLPITHVNVDMQYPGPVQRVHSDRARTLGAKSPSHNMYTPAVAARDRHTWERRLLIPVVLWDQMRRTTAAISFRAEDAGGVELTWPAERRGPARDLRKRLGLSKVDQPESPAPADK